MDRPFLTEGQREELFETFADLDHAAGKIRALMEPYEIALSNLDSVRARIEESHGIEVVGSCESCDRLLIVGDKAHICEDGPYLCEACGPTYGDVKRQWEESTDLDAVDQERKQACLERIEGHLKAGGALTDMMPGTVL